MRDRLSLGGLLSLKKESCWWEFGENIMVVLPPRVSLLAGMEVSERTSRGVFDKVKGLYYGEIISEGCWSLS